MCKLRKQWYIIAFIYFSCCILIFILAGIADEIPTSVKQITDNTYTISTNPNDAIAFYKRGVEYLSKNQEELAIYDFNKAIEINPKYADAYLQRGYLYEKRGQEDEAMHNYSQSISSDPNYVQGYDHRAFLYIKRGQYDLALIDCNKAIELNPNYVRAYLNKGTLYQKQRLYQEAIDTYRTLKKITPPEDIHTIGRIEKRIQALLEAL